MPATASANTIGIDKRISATKTMATVASSMNDPASVLRLAVRQRREHRRKAVDRNQHAADHRGRVEPGEVHLQARRREGAVEQAELEAVIRREQADARYQRVIEAVDPELRPLGQAVHEDRKREMRTRLDADGGADQRQPRQRRSEE